MTGRFGYGDSIASNGVPDGFIYSESTPFFLDRAIKRPVSTGPSVSINIRMAS